ncbi:unnamed protein product [Durusdinium trenchii]|uniref:DDRGK domain-containing protein 1 n=2 Tax=Durusdinium trenchii TaxID=1381693 RepID=A0ABP0MLQ3_9DINO
MAESGDVTLAALSVAFLFGILGLFVFFGIKARAISEEEEEQAKQAAQPRRRNALDRMQRGAARAGDEGEGGAEEAAQGAQAAKRTNPAKEAKKQEKRAQKQAEQEAQQQKLEKASEKAVKYSERQREREAERLRREEEDEKAREEKQKQEKEEMDKWKETFSVEKEGEDDGTLGEGVVEQFVDYVKLRKVVNLEDLAAEFRMRTVHAIKRLEELEKMGRLSGIFDDRGKYIYITLEEMASVASWLKKKGRINRADLVAGCNKLIRLNPTEEDQAKLDAEVLRVDESLEPGEGEDAAV